MHGILSVAWSLGISAVVVLAAVASRGWFRLYSIGTVLVMMAFGIASGIAFRGIEQNDTPWAGAFERINAYVLMAWLAILVVKMIRDSVEQMTVDHGATDGLHTRPLPREPAIAG
jgi:predicted membrane channel-forming protein YqfA (hemolysin III family)